MLGPPTMQDDRGRRVPLLEQEFVGVLHRDKAKYTRLVAAGWLQGRSTTDTRSVGVTVALCVVFFACVLASFSALRWLGAPGWTGAMVPPVGSLVLIFALQRAWRRARPMDVGAVYIRAGYCASCGYDLRPGAPGDDGLTECPECGAAWRMDGHGKSGARRAARCSAYRGREGGHRGVPPCVSPRPRSPC